MQYAYLEQEGSQQVLSTCLWVAASCGDSACSAVLYLRLKEVVIEVLGMASYGESPLR